MRTNHKSSYPQETIKQSLPYWIEKNHKAFFKKFKKLVKRDFGFDKKWGMYFQSYGLWFKIIQTVATEYDKKMNITSVILDKKLKKQIKKINKKIIKNG
jgi:hypothetical protein